MTGLRDCRVVANVERGPGYRELVLEEVLPRGGAPPERGLARAAAPGQFVHVLCGEGPRGDGLHRYLRRPFSIFRVERAAGTVSFLFRVVGDGTRWLARRRPGDVLSVLGPLGNGFPAARSGEEALLVGGGVGVPPLFFLARELVARRVRVRALLGARTAADLVAEEEFRALGVPLAVATEDGSRGHRGLVTDLLEEALAGAAGSEGAVVYACGPAGMLRAVQALAGRANAAAYLCLEERMACGVGACLGCPAAVPGGPEGEPLPVGPLPDPAERAAAYALAARAARGEAPVSYRRVCVDGPVFPAWGVVL